MIKPVKIFFQMSLLSVCAITVAVAQEVQEENNVRPELQLSSLMFLEQDIELIEKAEKSRDTKVPIEILLPDIFNKAVPQISRRSTAIVPDVPSDLNPRNEPEQVYQEPVEALNPADTPIYYLRSILYFSPENWTVWMGDNKISSSDESYEITDEVYGVISILSVEPRRIVALWEDFPPEMIQPEYKDNALNLDNDLYASEDMQMVYDAKKQKLAFILQPNQAIIPYLLSVTEGKNNANLMLFGATQQQPPEEEQAQPLNVGTVTLENVTPAKKLPAGDASQTEQQKRNMENYMKQIDLLQGVLKQIN